MIRREPTMMRNSVGSALIINDNIDSAPGPASGAPPETLAPQDEHCTLSSGISAPHLAQNMTYASSIY
jgi:hypothetical protein